MSEITEYQSQYKCRRCESLFSDGTGTGNDKRAEACIWYLAGVSVPPAPDSQEPTLFWPHACDDGGIGMADFIGWSCKNAFEFVP